MKCVGRLKLVLTIVPHYNLKVGLITDHCVKAAY